MPKRKLDSPELPLELLTPIEVEALQQPPILLETDKELKDHEEKKEASCQDIIKQQQYKLNMLFKHYGGKPNNDPEWEHLFLRIACDFISGFKLAPKKTRGAKQKWNDATLYVLWYEVHHKIKNGKSASWACNSLMKIHPWASILRQVNVKNSDPKPLYNAYLKSQKSTLVRFVNNICKSIEDVQEQEYIKEQMYKGLYDTAIDTIKKVPD